MGKMRTIITITVFLFGLFFISPGYSMASGHDSSMEKESNGKIDEGHHDDTKGSSGKTMTSEKAISGFCPVCLIDGNVAIKGKSAFTTVYKGKEYYFLGDEQKQKFLENPEKYVENLEEELQKAIDEQSSKGNDAEKKGSGNE